jgi:hypothetical protein
MPYLRIRSHYACTNSESREGRMEKVELDEFRALTVGLKEPWVGLIETSKFKFNFH